MNTAVFMVLVIAGAFVVLAVPTLLLAKKLRNNEISPGLAKVLMLAFVLLFMVVFVFFMGAVKSIQG